MYAARPTPIDKDAERNARDVWRFSRRPGDLTATFQAGETIRCPGTVEHEQGKSVCGAPQAWVAKPGTKVILRVRNPRLPGIPCAGVDLRACPVCHTLCEQFVTWDTRLDTPLEATGT